MMANIEGGLYVKRITGERLFLENVEWKMTKVLAVMTKIPLGYL